MKKQKKKKVEIFLSYGAKKYPHQYCSWQEKLAKYTLNSRRKHKSSIIRSCVDM